MHERYDAMWSPFHWDRPREPAVCYFSRYFRWSILNLPLSPPLKHTLRHNHEVWVNRQKNTPTGTVPSPMRAIQSISAICYCWHPSNRVNFLADSYVPLSNLERQKRNSKENLKGYVIIKYDSSIKQYTYEFKEDNEDISLNTISNNTLSKMVTNNSKKKVFF